MRKTIERGNTQRKSHPHLFRSTKLLELFRHRELGDRREGSHFVCGARELYLGLPLVLGDSSGESEHLSFVPIRFTYDGRQLLSFHTISQDLVILEYRGGPLRSSSNNFANQSEEQTLCKRYFPVQKTVSFFNPFADQMRFLPGHLIKDCVFVTLDSRHAVVVSAAPIPEHNSRLGPDQNNESINFGIRLDDFAFYAVDLEKATITDSMKFNCDHIKPSSGGVFLQDRTLVVLSVQHQTLHFFRIDAENGRFVPLKKMGRFTTPDGELLGEAGEQPMGELWFTEFRQRLLTLIFKTLRSEGREALFFQAFEHYRSLKMTKLQLVDTDFVLIKLEPNVHLPPDSSPLGAAVAPSYSSSTSSSSASSTAGLFSFVLLNWKTGELVGYFEADSDALFQIRREFGESFKSAHLFSSQPERFPHLTMFPTSGEHSAHSRWDFNTFLQNATASTSMSNIRRQLLQSLPHTMGSVQPPSPYLDTELFKIVSERTLFNCMSRGRQFTTNHPIRFHNQRNGQFFAALDLASQGNGAGGGSGPGSSAREREFPPQPPHLRVLFHPHDPLIVVFRRFTNEAFGHLVVFAPGNNESPV